jgi:hypothetical protein
VTEEESVEVTNDVFTAKPARVRRLATQPALALADLAGIFEDLQTALRCCERLIAELARADADRDDLALEAFWTIAVLSYARCFATRDTKTALTSEDVTSTGLAGDVLGWHDVLLQLRDHYADPQVNPRENFSVGVSRDDSGDANGIAITSALQPDVDDVTVRQTGAVAFELSRIVDRRIAEQQETVFGSLWSITRAQLDKLPLLDVVTPEPEGSENT